MRPKDFEIDVIREALQGTCDTLDSAIEECYPGMTIDDMTTEDHAFLDNEIFLCEECGWWCEMSESAEDGPEETICQSCADVR